MIKLFIFGINGKMGTALQQCAPSHSVEIVGGFGRQNNFTVYNNIEDIACEFDCIIDFSSAQCLDDILKLSSQRNKPVVLASTGHTKQQLNMIKKHSKNFAVLQSSNMSLGITVLLKLIQITSQMLPDFDLEIIETHHNMKHDVPSGTAKMMFEQAYTNNNNLKACLGRAKKNGKRLFHQATIHSIRGGTFVGEHKAIYFGQNQTISLTHSAQNRDIFAQGAIKAAQFIVDKSNGLFSMFDCLLPTTT
ncbi:MAG: 4-hydroxy-tetrahydrodipicolinate reductase [Clostridiales bacterium]|jgi:4-hydroxy-tetrahydrodipicolinate reductase|nr:4-hydroxy-tetrahydrodipicolinate reductase [Clostridiales bacterium]